MTDKQVEYAKKQLSTKMGGEFRNLFYTNRGLPRQKLYTKQQILDKLNIPEGDNQFEREGIYHKLHNSITLLRKEAKEHGIAFVDFRIERDEGRDIYYHGFLKDVDKIEKTIDLYNERLDNFNELYKLTYETGRNTVTMIEKKKQFELEHN